METGKLHVKQIHRPQGRRKEMMTNTPGRPVELPGETNAPRQLLLTTAKHGVTDNPLDVRMPGRGGLKGLSWLLVLVYFN